MSHKLKMYAYNATSHTIQSYTITHTWNDKGNTLDGKDLKSKSWSHHKEVTTGFQEYDWFTISVDIDGIGEKSTDFYCNSSQDHDYVVISIHDDHVNCEYFTKDNDPPTLGSDWASHKNTGCMHKSYR